MKVKAKVKNPIEFDIYISDIDFDEAKKWLNKALGFIDYNGRVNSKYSIELSIKESLVPDSSKEVDQK